MATFAANHAYQYWQSQYTMLTFLLPIYSPVGPPWSHLIHPHKCAISHSGHCRSPLPQVVLIQPHTDPSSQLAALLDYDMFRFCPQHRLHSWTTRLLSPKSQQYTPGAILHQAYRWKMISVDYMRQTWMLYTSVAACEAWQGGRFRRAARVPGN